MPPDWSDSSDNYNYSSYSVDWTFTDSTRENDENEDNQEVLDVSTQEIIEGFPDKTGIRLQQGCITDRGFIDTELKNEEGEEIGLSDQQIERIMQAIDVEFYREISEDASFYKTTRNFIGKFLKAGDKVIVDQNSLSSPEYEIDEEYIVLAFIDVEHEKRYLSRRILGEDEDGNRVDIPINDLKWDTIIGQIAKMKLDEGLAKRLLNPEIGNYSFIDLPPFLNFAFELEGGFESSRYDSYHFSDIGFNVDYDGSVSTHARYDQKEVIVDGYEAGSQIITKVEALLDQLVEEEYVSNESCGIHIHLSRNDSDWSMHDIIKVSRLVTGIEKQMFRYLPDCRVEKRHSAPMEKKNEGYKSFVSQPAPVLSAISQDGNIKNILGAAWYNRRDFDHSSRDSYHSSRYCGLNIHSYFYRGTIEFRHFDADPEMLPYFLDWVGAITEFAINHTYREIDRFINIVNSRPDSMFDRLPMNPTSADIIVQRANKFKDFDKHSELYQEVVNS